MTRWLICIERAFSSLNSYNAHTFVQTQTRNVASIASFLYRELKFVETRLIFFDKFGDAF